MPYRNPERKRQWEQRHRIERTEQRRLRRAQQHNQQGDAPVLPEKNSRGGWWALILGVAAIFLGIAAFPRIARGR